jgi:hypothetical protein
MAQPTERFRRQHAELSALALELVTQAHDSVAVTQNAPALRRALATFAGKLKIHAAMEDEALYPTLLRHDNEELRETARKLHESFGGVYRGFSEYLARWEPETIAAKPDAFRRETRAAMTALGERMKLETEVLYDKVDEVLGAI